LEVLVAAAITLVIAGLMLSVAATVLSLWHRGLGLNDQVAAARQVFALLERDLQAARCRLDAKCWLAIDILDNMTLLENHGWLENAGQMKPAVGGSLLPLPGEAVPGSAGIEQARFGLSGVWLRLVTTNVESGGGLPTVVAWQMVRRPITGDPVPQNLAPVHYSLYRSAVSPSETFATGYDVTAGVYGSTSNTPASALSTAYRQPRNVTNPSHANLLASHVVDFGCWLYTRTSAGDLRRIYPANVSDVSHHALGGNNTDGSRFPDVADVMIRLLNAEGASMVTAMEKGRLARPPDIATDAQWWWQVVESHSTVYTQRIEIIGGER